MSYTTEDLIRLYYYHASNCECGDDEVARAEGNQHWLLARNYLREIEKRYEL